MCTLVKQTVFVVEAVVAVAVVVAAESVRYAIEFEELHAMTLND